ncbi:MAG: c-type cytochrome [Acetobacteraceae bacterium]
MAAALAFVMFPVAGALAAGVGGLPPGPGRDLVYATCQTCHSLDALTESAGVGRDAWSGILASMRQYGLSVTPANEAKILGYLATYLGPHPPPAAPAATPESAPKSIDGKALFETNCSTCHQANGEGSEGYFPPLSGNRDLFLSRVYPAYVVLNGLSGEITVGGHSFNGQMPSFAQLSDAEIAAIVTYIRSAWNNQALQPHDMPPIDAEAVKQARAKPMSPAAVHAYRAGHEPKPGSD